MLKAGASKKFMFVRTVWEYLISMVKDWYLTHIRRRNFKFVFWMKSGGTETLELLLKTEDSFDIDISYGPLKDAILLLATKIDKLAKQNSIQSSAPNEDLIEEIAALSKKLDEMGSKYDGIGTDFSSEIGEVKSYFSFQFKELKDKFEKEMKSIKETASLSVTPQTLSRMPSIQ